METSNASQTGVVDGLGIWRGPFFGLGLTATSLLLEHRHMKAPYSIIVVNGLITLLVVNCFVGDAFDISYNPQYSVNFFFSIFSARTMSKILD